ncbi:energy transducer TonB [Tenacibaculum insulae]|uniref:energy transducer TonB n=1 Tax=Tenacibaculum insulae TaxID=2029677 RepID=UPI003AB2721B
MRIVNILLFISLLSINCYSQRGKKLANIFFNKSVSSFEANELDRSADLLAKSLNYYGESIPIKVSVFGSKLHIKKKEYSVAQKYVKRFFEQSKNKKSAQYKYMLELHVNLEAVINGEGDFVALKEIVEDVNSVEKAKVNSVVNNDVPAIDASELVIVKDSITKSVNNESALKVVETKEEVLKEETVVVDEKKVSHSVIEVEEPLVSIDLTAEKDSLLVNENESGIMGVKARLLQKMREKNNVVKEEFKIVETYAVYPGCSEDSNKKKCFNLSLRKFINDNFQVDYPELAKLITGKVTVFIKFRINKEGVVDSVDVKAPHDALKKEAIRVVELLPKMKPATAQGKPVGFRLSLPLSFNIEEQ